MTAIPAIPRAPLDAAAERRWDALVIGAGPAGATAAHTLATRGLVVLLVDRAAFPRPKVCGGCLNDRALATLARLGLARATADARPLRALRLAAGRRTAALPLPRTLAIDRAAFDTHLATSAVRAGACFIDDVSAKVTHAGSHHDPAIVTLTPTDGAAPILVRARCVLAADGLAGSSLCAVPPLAPVVSPTARFGAGATLDGTPHELRRLALTDAATLSMTIGPRGYLGACRLPDGRITLGAALAPAFARALSGPGPAAAAILRSAGLDPPASLATARWYGTPTLTRRRPRIAHGRVLVIGDAAGYVEPFTGEGMAWALAGAEAVAPIAHALAAGGDPDRAAAAWTAIHRRLVARRQHLCRALAAALRVPPVVAAALALASVWPALASPILSGLRDRPPRALLLGEGGPTT
jgi:flavin-dependent dehydrogenase